MTKDDIVWTAEAHTDGSDKTHCKSTNRNLEFIPTEF